MLAIRLSASVLVFAPLICVSNAFAGSETPPTGPPWKVDFASAHKEALREGKPIFIYTTKTY
jgi:hypothetical protein